MNGNHFFELYKVKFGKLKFVLRQNVVDDYWVFEGLLFADEYYPLRLKRSDIVLDVGANIGIFTCKAALEVNRVYSIEPEPNNFELLKKNVEINGLKNVTLINYAVSDVEETLYFKHTGGSAKAAKNGIPIKAKTIDSILEELGNPKITVLKMDIEGYEMKALLGFSKYNCIREIIIETHSKELTEQVINKLSQWGMTVKDVSHIKRSKVMKNIINHPISFLSIERKNKFWTLKQTLSYFIGHGKSPVAADNEGSEQRIIYGTKN